jgi:hypothetical protein
MPLFRATEPGTIPVPHRRRSSGVASGRGFLPTVLGYPEPRLSVARKRPSLGKGHLALGMAALARVLIVLLAPVFLAVFAAE